MFLHRVKMNWKRYQKLTMAILLFALARIVLETCFGEAPLGAFADFRLALILLAATVAWAFLKTCVELGAVYYKSCAPSRWYCENSAAITGVRRRQFRHDYANQAGRSFIKPSRRRRRAAGAGGAGERSHGGAEPQRSSRRQQV